VCTLFIIEQSGKPAQTKYLTKGIAAFSINASLYTNYFNEEKTAMATPVDGIVSGSCILPGCIKSKNVWRWKYGYKNQ
jgi:hypothetical protein